jgi:UDP-N-acetylglucosamine transferase subunit ALG13
MAASRTTRGPPLLWIVGVIFLTVGSQLPFDRLTTAVDDWAARRPGLELFGQVGNTDKPPANFASVATMSPEEYQRRFADADLIVAHAGMGTIIAALESGKPLLMLPRVARLGESRNDNQVGTARHFSSFGLFEVAESEFEISARMDHMLANLQAHRRASDEFGVADSLLDTIREFVSS